MENQMTTSTISDELYDGVFIYKLFSSSTLLKSLKQIQNVEVFTTLKPFCFDKLKVCLKLYKSHSCL